MSKTSSPIIEVNDGPRYVTIDTFDIERLSFADIVKKTNEKTQPDGSVKSTPYNIIPIVYTHVDSDGREAVGDLLFEFPKGKTSWGTQCDTEDGNEKIKTCYSIEDKEPEHIKLLEIMDSIHQKIAEHAYPIRGKLGMPNYSLSNTKSGFSKPIKQKIDVNTCEPVKGSPYNIYLKHWKNAKFNIPVPEGEENKTIDFRLLDKCEFAFIPMVRSSHVYCGGEKMSIINNCNELTIAGKIEKKGDIVSQTGTIHRVGKDSELVNIINASIMKIEKPTGVKPSYVVNELNDKEGDVSNSAGLSKKESKTPPKDSPEKKEPKKEPKKVSKEESDDDVEPEPETPKKKIKKAAVNFD
jgi:hypothetical protein